MRDKYIVKVDDNFHYMDESERYFGGLYNTLEEAIEKCKKITIESLESFYKKDIKPNELLTQWTLFGEDPFIVTESKSQNKVPFSARKFVTTKLCKEIIKKRILNIKNYENRR